LSHLQRVRAGVACDPICGPAGRIPGGRHAQGRSAGRV